MKQIVIFTSNRSEWGLLKPLAIELEKRYKLKIIACASHLNPIYDSIEDIDGFNYESIECTLSSNTKEGCCKSSGILMITLPDILKKINPELVVILGDRYESFVAASVCFTMSIKILHLHGGEQSGNIDDVFRNCITQMSYIHCVATQNAFDRLSDNFNNVYLTGALGLQGLEKSKFRNKHNIVVSYHPVTNEEKEDFFEILDAIYNFCQDQDRDYLIDFILANNDFGGYDINRKIRDFCSTSGLSTAIHAHLERDKFIKLLSDSACIIGNSSCGIIEAPYLGVPTINIGNRQKNRDRAYTIIDCKCNSIEILLELEDLENKNFDLWHNHYFPYQGGDVVYKILIAIEEVLKNG